MSILSVSVDPESQMVLKQSENSSFEDSELTWMMTSFLSCDRCKLHHVNFARYNPVEEGWKNNSKVKSMLDHHKICKNISERQTIDTLQWVQKLVSGAEIWSCL